MADYNDDQNNKKDGNVEAIENMIAKLGAPIQNAPAQGLDALQQRVMGNQPAQAWGNQAPRWNNANPPNIAPTQQAPDLYDMARKQVLAGMAGQQPQQQAMPNLSNQRSPNIIHIHLPPQGLTPSKPQDGEEDNQ